MLYKRLSGQIVFHKIAKFYVSREIRSPEVPLFPRERKIQFAISKITRSRKSKAYSLSLQRFLMRLNRCSLLDLVHLRAKNSLLIHDWLRGSHTYSCICLTNEYWCLSRRTLRWFELRIRDHHHQQSDPEKKTSNFKKILCSYCKSTITHVVLS